MFKQRKYDDMYLRAGVINNEDTMEWMEVDYDQRTLKDLTGDSNILIFLNNLLDILKIDTPNINILSNSLGEFINKNQILCSNSIYNKGIKNIEIHPTRTSNFETETSKIIIQFKDETILKDDLEEILKKHSLDTLKNSNTISNIENTLVSFKANLTYEISLDANNNYVDKIIFEYL